jgi:hypothetical protein
VRSGACAVGEKDVIVQEAVEMVELDYGVCGCE